MEKRILINLKYKQNSNCEAGEDNNNSCNNISISRHDGEEWERRVVMAEEIKFKYLNKTQTARQEKITTIHAITSAYPDTMVVMTEEIKFKYLNKTQTARQEKITTIHAITSAYPDTMVTAVGALAAVVMTEEIKFKYLNKTQTARQEKRTTIHAIILILKK